MIAQGYSCLWNLLISEPIVMVGICKKRSEGGWASHIWSGPAGCCLFSLSAMHREMPESHHRINRFLTHIYQLNRSTLSLSTLGSRPKGSSQAAFPISLSTVSSSFPIQGSMFKVCYRFNENWFCFVCRYRLLRWVSTSIRSCKMRIISIPVDFWR